MSFLGRTTLLCTVLLALSLTAVAQRRSTPSVSIEGTYDNLTVGKESGDHEGIRVILIDGGGGIYAIVQEAEGGVELPAPASTLVTVKGTDISFAVKLAGHDESQMFSGKVSASGLRLRSDGQQFFLKRKKC
jgi:hypothetical protein